MNDFENTKKGAKYGAGLGAGLGAVGGGGFVALQKLAARDPKLAVLLGTLLGAGSGAVGGGLSGGLYGTGGGLVMDALKGE